MSLEIGQQARMIAPVVEGEIIDTEYDKDAKELRHLLRYTDATGEAQTRWFRESQLEEVTE